MGRVRHDAHDRLRRARQRAEHAGAAAASRRVSGATASSTAASIRWNSISYPPNAPLTARPDWRGRPARRRTRSTQLARAGARSLGRRHRHLQLPLRRAAPVQRGHGGGVRRARSTTGWPRNGSTATRGCAPRSWCRCRTPSSPSTRSSAAPRTGASCRCWCWPWARRRSAAGTTGRSTRPPSGTACRSASMPGSSYRHPVTSLGWPSYYVEDYAAQSQGFQTQLGSLVCEGVFAKFPEAQGGAAGIRRHLAAGLPVAACRNSGAACAPRCRGSTARRGRSCAIMCG